MQCERFMYTSWISLQLHFFLFKVHFIWNTEVTKNFTEICWTGAHSAAGSLQLQCASSTPTPQPFKKIKNPRHEGKKGRGNVSFTLQFVSLDNIERSFHIGVEYTVIILLYKRIHENYTHHISLMSWNHMKLSAEQIREGGKKLWTL